MRWLRAGGAQAAATCLVLLLAGCGSASRRPPTPLPRGLVSWVALDRRCAREAARWRPYPWPLRPFRRQHPVRGFFGDPRTAFAPTEAPRPGARGAFGFHNGVDIVGGPGQKVYPVVSGIARVGGPQEVDVRAPGGQKFQYWHVFPFVRSGARVVAGRTVLGRIRADWGHVHLTEIRGSCVVNPLAPGHLEPYRDRTRPAVLAVAAITETGSPLDPRHLRGGFELVARAADRQPLPAPGSWRDLPVTPAVVAWSLRTAGGREVVAPTVVADFRTTVPPDREFWRVYAPGSRENIVFGHGRERRRLPGVYAFRLTGRPLVLPAGTYVATVTVADTAGNRGARSQFLRVR